MNKRLLFTIISIFFVFTPSYSNNLIISLKNDLNYLLDISSNDINSKIYFNNLNLSARYEYKEFTAKITINKNIGNISLYDIDITQFNPLEFNNNNTDLVFNNFYPTLFFKIDESWIKFNMKQVPEFSYNVEIPLSRNISIGLTNNYLSLSEELNILGSYNLIFNPEVTKTSGFIDIKFGDFNAGFTKSKISVEIEPELGTVNNLTLLFKTESDYSYKTYIQYQNKNLSIKISGEASGFTFGGDEKIYGFNNEKLFMGNDQESFFKYLNISTDTKYKNLSFNLSHTLYTLGEIDLFFNTDSFIYGPIAYRHYDIFLPNMVIYNSSINIENRIESSFGEFTINLGYRRLYTEKIVIKSGYKEYLGLFTIIPQLIYISALDEETLRYDHLNILNISLKHKVKIISNFYIITGVSQLLPFFDFKKLETFTKMDSIETNTENYIRGGFKLSIELRVIL